MLEIEGVSIRFGDNPEAVSDTTFTVGDGDRLAVVGETGSGKSVLLLAAIHSIPWATSFARPFESISPVPGKKRWFRRPRCWSPLGWSMVQLCAAAILFSSPAVCASGY